ncbi:MAG: DUF308 domain-containing protein [Sarcina sp.]
MKILSIIEAILLFAVGILFFTKPLGVLVTITTLVGILFIIYAIIKFIRLWNRPDKTIHVIMCVIDGLFGLILIFFPITTMGNLIIIYGIWAFIRGIYTLIYSIKLKDKTTIIYSILLIIFGLIIIFCPIVVLTLIPIIPYILGAYFIVIAIIELYMSFKMIK